MKIQRQHRHNMIAINDAALFADEDGAIGVPVQRHPEMSPLLSDRLLQQFGMDRATAGIDIHPVRLIADYFYLRSEFAQHRRRNLVGCAIGTIDHHIDPLEVQLLRKRPFDKLDVPPLGIVDSIGFPNGIGRRP